MAWDFKDNKKMYKSPEVADREEEIPVGIYIYIYTVKFGISQFAC